MKTLTYITGNKYKFEVAQKALEAFDIELLQEDIETPEIQSESVEAIASFSARWAARELGKPVALTDAGYYIESLNGFPGPFIKYANHWFTAHDFLRLLDEKENRGVVVRTCLAYCEPNNEPVTFTCEARGTIAQTAVQTEKEGGTPINEIFVPKGFEKVETEIPREDMVAFWAQTENYWVKLAKYLHG